MADKGKRGGLPGRRKDEWADLQPRVSGAPEDLDKLYTKLAGELGVERQPPSDTSTDD